MIPAFAAIRWLHEASLMALFGDAALRILLRGRLPALAPPQEKWRMIAALIAAVSALLWFVLAAAQMAGDPRAMTDTHLLGLPPARRCSGRSSRAAPRF